jgi:glutamate---cysteine ligase / carboxylate-amine ligase
MSAPPALHLFEAFGVELEYMIVAERSLDVLPAADEVLRAAAGEYVADVERGDISWSNELALHVIELKTTGPAAGLEPLAGAFQENVRHINRLLAPLGGRLMPSAMHPWMDPHRDLKLWPHDNSPIYETFNRIFDCRGHGWANLQSVHLNLPFAGDEEFSRLHSAIRLLLPILPALAASSPLRDGRLTGLLDSRLDVYRGNCARVPSVTGLIIPEPVSSRQGYEDRILGPMYADMVAHDPEGTLRHEWLNARGAIARFERNTIEVRVLDVQECPLADLAICAGVSAVLRLLVSETLAPLKDQQNIATERLRDILLATARDAEQAVIEDADYLRLLSFKARPTCTAKELWRHLLREVGSQGQYQLGELIAPLHLILDRGPLARRILQALGDEASRHRLEEVYGQLCDCLAAGRMFVGRS